VLGAPPALRPVLVSRLHELAGRAHWSLGDPALREAGMLEVESRATAYDLPAIRWPRPWPSDFATAMRVATWADARGAGTAFAFAAARRAFLSGCDLSDPAQVAEAARDAGLDPEAALAAAADPAVARALGEATDAAFARGVVGVPTVAVGDRLFFGDDRLEDAARTGDRNDGGSLAAATVVRTRRSFGRRY
jgi:2-hydroxychromene-2-carboxylate isomerase